MNVRLPLDLQEILLPPEENKLRSEADFYGISTIIAHQVGLKEPPKSYSMWRHGWIHQPLKFVEQIIWKDGYTQNYLVAKAEQETFLKNRGISNVKAVGLPFSYVPEQNVQRKNGSLLLMPAHSLPYVDLSMERDEEQMISLALSLRQQFDLICFCIHSDCIRTGRYINKLNQLGIPWFTGASAKDSNSLIKLRRVFEYFDVVGSNVVGSHMIYAQSCGAKFFFTENYFNYRDEMYRDDPILKDNRLLRDHLLKYSHVDEVMTMYGKYFVSPTDAICDRSFALGECGFDCKLPAHDLALMLGWSPLRQISGLFISGLERTMRGARRMASTKSQ